MTLLALLTQHLSTSKAICSYTLVGRTGSPQERVSALLLLRSVLLCAGLVSWSFSGRFADHQRVFAPLISPADAHIGAATPGACSVVSDQIHHEVCGAPMSVQVIYTAHTACLWHNRCSQQQASQEQL